MGSSEIHPARVKELSSKPVSAKKSYVLYWMQQSQRTHDNHALEYAIKRANEAQKPLVVCFGIMEDYPEASERHFCFLLEGLAQVAQDLQKRGIKFVVRRQHPRDIAIELAKDACEVVCDCAYLRHLRKWRAEVSETVSCKVTQVESDVVVPVETASEKQEHAARTIRKKLQKKEVDFSEVLRRTPLTKDSTGLKIQGESLKSPHTLLKSLSIDRSVPQVSHLHKGGQDEAVKVFKRFLRNEFDSYEENRNHPETDSVSYMSMYLQYGHVSPRQLLEMAREEKSRGKNLEAFVEELLVRRELQHNFVYYCDNYDSFKAVPAWAVETLHKHAKDKRDHQYTREEMENAETHDDYWNASMIEMRETGYMHNYMRMYWGKKILEWSSSPEYAHKTALALNNKYLLDGMNANTYGNILWLFGIHDRGWPERPVFGKVRSMMASGLERKCDIKAYVEKVRERAA